MGIVTPAIYLIFNKTSGAACDLAAREMAFDQAWMETLSQRFLDKIYSKLTHVIRNGDPNETYCGCINLSFAYVEGNIFCSYKPV